MTNKELTSLRAFQRAKKNAFRPSFVPPSRRSAKSKSNATGQLGLKSFRIVPAIGLNSQPFQRKQC